MSDTFQFNQTEEERRVLSQNGPWAHASLKEQIPRQYPDLNLIQMAQGEYETWRNDLDQKFLLRVITKGLNFRPSRQIGTGRQFNQKEMRAKMSELEKIVICDCNTYPIISVAFVDPMRLLAQFPTGVASYFEALAIFGSNLDDL